MVTDELFDRFKVKRPVCLMARMALSRVLSCDALDELFREHAQEQYERKITFSSLTAMMAEIVLRSQPSVNAAFKANREFLGASLTAVCNKLDRVEPRVSQALVRYSYEQALGFGNYSRTNDPSCVPGYRTKVLDGNHLGGTDHRIKELRPHRAAALPGKSLVVLDPQLRAAQDYFPLENGHSQERSALDNVIETICRKDLWVADRNFCTLKFMYSIDARGAAFVIRHHQKLVGHVRGARRKIGHSATGVVYERTMVLPEYDGNQIEVRQVEIDLHNPTRNKDETVILLTNLPPNRADAVKVAEIYRRRWKIETLFQILTQTLRCEVNTLGYPRAALFAFAVSLIAYNAVAIIQAAIRNCHGKREADQLSHYYMALEIAQAQDGMMVLLDESDFQYLEDLPIEQFAAEMHDVAKCVDLQKFRKNVRGPKKPVKKKPRNKAKPHIATAKLLAERKKSAC